MLTADPETAKALNRLAREQAKEKLLTDILMDMAVCDVEGWDKLEYIRELREVLDFGQKAGNHQDTD